MGPTDLWHIVERALMELTRRQRVAWLHTRGIDTDGTRLPENKTQRELANTFNCSRLTIRQDLQRADAHINGELAQHLARKMFGETINTAELMQETPDGIQHTDHTSQHWGITENHTKRTPDERDLNTIWARSTDQRARESGAPGYLEGLLLEEWHQRKLEDDK